MKVRITKQADFWAGLMFIGFGMLAMGVSFEYPAGTLKQMGPGFFPRYVGLILTVLGGIIALISLQVESAKIEPFAWRGIVMLSIGFLIFGWGIDRFGFVPALLAMIFCSSAAGRNFRIRDVLVVSAILVTGAVLLFIYFLKLPFPLFWWR